MFVDDLNTGTAGAGGSEAVSPAAPGSGVTAPPADGSAVASPAASPVISWETAPEKLRTEYETQKAEAARLKAEAEQWSKLGKYDEVSTLQSAFSAKLTQATAIGKTLGYTDQQIRDAMMEDPKGTLAFLQQEYAKPATASNEDIDKRFKEMLASEVQPLRSELDSAKNEKAESLYHAERDRLFKSEFADGLPDENREELYEILDNLISSDPAALQRLKFQNQVSDVSRHMTQAKVILLKRHNSYIAHERGKGEKAAPTGKSPDKPNGTHMDHKLSAKFGGGTVKELLGGL